MDAVDLLTNDQNGDVAVPGETLEGLSPEQIIDNRERFGSNRLYLHPKRSLVRMLAGVATEPVFLLLVLTCGLYFVLGDQSEAWMMVGSVVFVVLIELIQEFRSEKALTALRQLTQPGAVVIRGGQRSEIPVEEVVVDDLLVFAEGERIAADAILLQQNDLQVDESILTGESLPVHKSCTAESGRLFQGTVVTSGSGIAKVSAVGVQTEFGKLGKSIESIETAPTPLQQQINRFVRQMLLAGLAVFLIVLAINYSYADSFISALLFSLAFALALVPEEIPVAFTTFMALGAYRMTRQKVLVKQPTMVESLGMASVICLDKTGTITENRMSVAEIHDFSGLGQVLEYAMWASEPQPFDPMEKAIHAAYEGATTQDIRSEFRMIHEYPLSGIPPMMTHVYRSSIHPDSMRIAAKGAVERIVRVCRLPKDAEQVILKKTSDMAGKGYRVLAVASSPGVESFPSEQDDFPWKLEGLVALYDPPKPNIRDVINGFYEAGVAVKMVTGDHPETAVNIARESGIRVEGEVLTGNVVMQMQDSELRQAAEVTTIFARMFPDAKLRLVEALKTNGEVVVMSGDGVNDGPALKAAQVGVAMGQRGTEVAKGAASLVLLTDDLSLMIGAIGTGRRIYQNLHKAIRYIISIHLPIILTVLVPLVLGWPYLHMLLPIHVIFLELIMDPVCAVAFENEPDEPGLLKKPPRVPTVNLFSFSELAFSLLQGIMITVGILVMYRYAIYTGKDEATTRSFVFATILAANVFLTLANRSFRQTIVATIFYRNQLLWWILGISSCLAIAVLSLPALQEIFQLGSLTLREAGYCLAAAALSTGWVEVWKWVRFGASDQHHVAG